MASPDPTTCSATKADGTPCQSPFVMENGRCQAHQDDGPAKLSVWGSRGGKVAAARMRVERGLVEDLPPLQSLDDARMWLEQIGRGVLLAQLTPDQANSARQIVAAWVNAQREKTATELRQQIEELKRLRRA